MRERSQWVPNPAQYIDTRVFGEWQKYADGHQKSEAVDHFFNSIMWGQNERPGIIGDPTFDDDL